MACAQCTMKSERSTRPQATRRQRGRAVTPGYRSRSLASGGVRGSDWTGGTAISLLSRRALPLCANGRRRTRYRRQKRHFPHARPLIHCRLVRKHRWAGAATPAQRNTVRPQQPPRGTSDLINGTPVLRKGNPRWPIGNVAETAQLMAAATMPRSSASTADLIQEHQAAGVTAALLGTAASVVARLANLPRRFGNSFFAMNDAEAGWRDWEVIVLARGLGRQYRDPRF